MVDRRGTLYVVATPIGNQADLSRRAVETLKAVAVVACEDTRHSGRLLAAQGIEARLLSLHEHNERLRLPKLIEILESGEDVALISDAGTPLLSDPGYPLVRGVVDAGLAVVAVPGASALLSALVVSALPPHPFTFLGFPPPKSGRRRAFFERFASLPHTLVFYESPHRILRCLADASAILGRRSVAVCRELTKLHEEILRGDIDETRETLAARPQIRGEIVVVVAGAGFDANAASEPEP